MTNMTSSVSFVPAINSENHGPIIILAGGIMTGPLIMLVIIAFYVRSKAGTVFSVDGILLLLGAFLDLSVFAVYNVLTSHAFGQRTTVIALPDRLLLKRVLLGNFMLIFLSHGATKIAYNILARRTVRDQGFKTKLDVFNGVIGAWTMVNILVIIVSLARSSSVSRAFMWASGIVSIGVMVGQFVIWMFIIWRTNTKRAAKIRWTISIGAFTPFCIATTICRLCYTPKNFFGSDWTFHDIGICTLFVVELNLATMNVLAPNLPIFFEKTSFGGMYFLPGEASFDSKLRSRKDSAITVRTPRLPVREVDDVYKGDEELRTVASTISRAEERESSLVRNMDNNVIMVRRSIEIERTPVPVAHDV